MNFQQYLNDFSIPIEEKRRTEWLNALSGHELTLSEFLCINHFKQHDLRKHGSRIVLDKGAIPQAAFNNDETSQPHLNENVSSGCESCKWLKCEINNLKVQIMQLNAEHNLETSSLKIAIQNEKEKNRKLLGEKVNLKNVLAYHKKKENNLKSVIDELKQENLISDEAASNLSVL